MRSETAIIIIITLKTHIKTPKLISDLCSINYADYNVGRSLIGLKTFVGDHPEDVKARLKYWAQAVACTVRLCN